MTSKYFVRQRQSGAALMFSLIFLLLLTVLTITAMQSSTLQERMAGNARDQSLAFQAAEAGLHDAEALLRTAPPIFDTTGPYRIPLKNPTSPATWNAYNWGDDSKQVATALEGINAADKPRYVVEELNNISAAALTGSGIDVGSQSNVQVTIYRVTSKGTGSTGKAVVILQSTSAPSL